MTVQSCRPLLGTYVEIRMGHDDPQAGEAAVNSAFDAIERVQQLMSIHEPASDVSALNRTAHLEPHRVADWTYTVLVRAKEIHVASDGLFECNVAHRLAGWGLLPASVISQGEDRASLADLQVLDDGRIGADRPLSMDLGGIAKGFAVDKAAEVLMAQGARWAVVNAGGDLRVVGDIEETIHVRSPREPSHLHLLGRLREGAVATSGCYFSAELAALPGVSALIDPRSGKALSDEHSYSVVAPDCTTADALTKVLALSGDPQHPCFRRFGAHALIL